KAPRTKKPNYNLIYADPLPLQVVPLPPLIPHNPLSIIYILYTYLFPPKSSYSHPTPLYKGTFSRATSSVNVTDPVSLQGLWCRGFFGKGSLSRSEPTWLTRTKRRLGVIGQNENLTAEELTERRRIERREFKKERARKEKEKVQQILAQEGKISASSTDGMAEAGGQENIPAASDAQLQKVEDSASTSGTIHARRTAVDVQDLEHLQLTLQEAFFLSYGLGALSIMDECCPSGKPLTNPELLKLFRMYSYFPAKPADALQPDDPFLVHYAVYHHFRSLGWVVKAGVKFSVDYLLYDRGPAFSHAEFAVTIIPSYSDPYWQLYPEKGKMPEWHWLHCINRVSSQVKKTLVLCFVEIPPPLENGGNNSVVKDIAGWLGRYKVREVSLRRWLPSRNRD
ncbi:hypothetical protein BDZ91DRAFT_633210, partial [Kalaharituber pfeilii]